MQASTSNHYGIGARLARRFTRTAAAAMSLGGVCGLGPPAGWLQVKRVKMPLKGLGESFAGTTIAHISDIHCSPLVSGRFLRRCVETVNAMEVDFVAITGDMVLTASRANSRRAASVLGALTPKIGSFACLGNHDYGIWRPNGQSESSGAAENLCESLAAAGVRVLNNESQIFSRNGDTLRFAGVEDLWSSRHDPHAAMRDADADTPTVMLCHNPDAAPKLAEMGVQWVLAGHTHGRTPKSSNSVGLQDAMFPVVHRHLMAGKHHLGRRRHLYVNTGLNFRYRARRLVLPEITVFTMDND